MPPLDSILWIVLPLVLLYFLMARGNSKRAKEQQNTQAQLTPGTRVMTTSGVYGTVRHVGARQIVVEIAPGVDMTILKQAISKVVPADEDEFEYDDTDADDAAEAADAEAQAVAEDDGFGEAIAGFHAPDAADPQAPDTAPGDEPGPEFKGYPGREPRN